MGFSLPLLISTFMLLLLSGCSPAPETTAKIATEDTSVAHQPVALEKSFVKTDGRRFMRGAEPYYIVGVNFWFGAYLGAENATGDRKRLIRELDLLQATGVNNLRVLAISEDSELMRAVRPAIATKEGHLDADLLNGLDFLLAEMAKRDMTAVLYLNNFWQWSGGMSQYVSWFNQTPVFDPDATGRWNEFMQNSALFYSIPEAQQLFQSFIKQLLTRTNSINGVAYANDPTIMSWQLANEPRPGSDEKGLENAESYKAWIKDTAQFIKSLAPKQLVSTGSEGTFGSARNEALYREAHSIAEVDYLTFHMWAKNWGWFDSQNAEATYDAALTKALAYVDLHIDIANDLNKPTVIEEFGLDRDLGLFNPESSTIYRDKYFKAIFARLTDRAAMGDAIAGYNIWAWGGYGRSTRQDYMWQKGDDFLGDPPQEPQGLNSVLDTDLSTLAIMKESAENFLKSTQ